MKGRQEGLPPLECSRMRFRRAATFFLALVISTVWLIPSVAPQSIAYGQTLGQGISVAGNLTVRLIGWLSTGTSFAYQGNPGLWRHNNFDWYRARDLLTGNFTNSGLP